MTTQGQGQDTHAPQPKQVRHRTRHTVTFRVAGERSACDAFVRQVLRVMLAAWDVSVTYERRDNDHPGDIPWRGGNSV